MDKRSQPQPHLNLVAHRSKFQEPRAAGQCERLVDLLPAGATQNCSKRFAPEGRTRAVDARGPVIAKGAGVIAQDDALAQMLMGMDGQGEDHSNIGCLSY